MNNKTKKIIAAIVIGAMLIAIPFLEWGDGNWNEKVPNQFKEQVEEEGDTIEADNGSAMVPGYDDGQSNPDADMEVRPDEQSTVVLGE